MRLKSSAPSPYARIYALGVISLISLLTSRSASAATNPRELKTQGASLFASKGCAHCHGDSGFGGSDSGPDLSNVRKELKPAEITQQIHDGGNNMPPFGDALTEDEISSLVLYLRSKRKPPPGYHAHKAAVNTKPAEQNPKPESE